MANADPGPNQQSSAEPLTYSHITLFPYFLPSPLMEEKKKASFWDKIRNRYRLVVMNDDTFEEQFSLKLTPLNIFILTGLVSILMITLTVSLVAFTPLREFIPGYGSEANTRKKLINLSLKLDSLEYELDLSKKAFENIQHIISGDIEGDTISNKNK